MSVIRSLSREAAKNHLLRARLFAVLAGIAVPSGILAADWHPGAGPLRTRWAKEVSPTNAHPEYPRPQLVRKEWRNLNGLWEYAIRARHEPKPAQFEGSILVPFPVESSLSGVMRRVGPESRLWYRRTFTIPRGWSGRRVLLHFDAVDWDATVWVDGRQMIEHRGGYWPFTIDLSMELEPERTHQLVVAVWDPSDASTQPRGKQVNHPSGIFYTPTTGIWQTVWLEPVPKANLDRVLFEPAGPPHAVALSADVAGEVPAKHKLQISVDVFEPSGEGEKPAQKIVSARGPLGAPLRIEIPAAGARLWSPDSPSLYDAVVRLTDESGNQVLDEVRSYFALRHVEVLAAERRARRIGINGKPLFLIGPLDQGFWPDGLYTAPTDAALRSDLEMTKRLGFNLVRKHVKVEPARWYYWCDRLGLAVFQDMPSGDRSAPDRRRGSPEIHRSAESARQFETELAEMIEARRFFPCIIAWVPFNEGWGQFDTMRIAREVKRADPNRLVVPASGWNDFPVGDIHDVHAYPGPAAPPPEPSRAAVLGEFGGLGLPLVGHLWTEKKNWGYRTFRDPNELTAAYLGLANLLRPLVKSHLSAAVYTQTTDVETEVNGLMTYDRERIKMDADRLRAANRALIDLIPARHE